MFYDFVNIIDKREIIIYYVSKSEKGGRSMDVIQRTMAVFDSLVQRVKDIASMLIYNYLPATSTAKSTTGLFWIFNW